MGVSTFSRVPMDTPKNQPQTQSQGCLPGLDQLLIFRLFGGQGGMAPISVSRVIRLLISGMLLTGLWSGVPLKTEQSI